MLGIQVSSTSIVVVVLRAPLGEARGPRAHCFLLIKEFLVLEHREQKAEARFGAALVF